MCRNSLGSYSSKANGQYLGPLGAYHPGEGVQKANEGTNTLCVGWGLVQGWGKGWAGKAQVGRGCYLIEG